jgi:hypothetical protein
MRLNPTGEINTIEKIEKDFPELEAIREFFKILSHVYNPADLNNR